jgi:uncharacterized protein
VIDGQLSMKITVAHSERARELGLREIDLPNGSTLADALRMAAIEVDPSLVGVWGRVRAPDWVLHEGDRVELYRPLTVDPMQARRLRHEHQRREREAAKGGKPTRAAKLAARSSAAEADLPADPCADPCADPPADRTVDKEPSR